MKRQSLYFLGNRAVEVRSEDMPSLDPDYLLVETIASAVSAGTEMLFYRGHVPDAMAIDATLADYQESISYPLKYGYSAVGRVVEAGRDADPDWLGQRVFAFQPHQSHFWAKPDDLLPIPAPIGDTQALFLPNMETAVNLVMDARPVLGERVIVMGLGVVGLLVTALLARFPLDQLAGIDPVAARRHLAEQWGARQTCPPGQPMQDGVGDPDLILELSGNPAALNLAIKLAGFKTRIVVGSWYGTKGATLDLGGEFHRNRVQLQSSQVSSLEPDYMGRWTKARRLDVAWSMLTKIEVERLVTHWFPLAQAGHAYDLIDRGDDHALQVLFTYGPDEQHWVL